MSKDIKTGELAKRSWKRLILPVSLALNLLFVGAIVGAGWMRNKHGGGFAGPPGFMVKYMLRHLPDDKQRSIFDQITEHREGQRSKRREIKGFRVEFRKALKGEPFNAELVRRVAQNMHRVRGELVGAKMELFVKVLAQLTPEERQKVMESRFFRRLLNRGGRQHFQRR
ncbi:MAG: periplasmic heavy metal sensor [bacterium]|nr:periplasmic heavy metal sensor [bacterium]